MLVPPPWPLHNLALCHISLLGLVVNHQYPVTANHLIRTLSRTKHLQKVIKEYLIATVLSTEVHIPNVAKYVRNCAWMWNWIWISPPEKLVRPPVTSKLYMAFLFDVVLNYMNHNQKAHHNRFWKNFHITQRRTFHRHALRA